MAKTSSHFAQNYAEARQKFLDAAKDAGLTVQSHANPNKGPDGGALFTDVVLAGDAHAPNLFVGTSATHGVEGFCGSGAMVGFLREGLTAERPKDTAVLLVHAFNPYGFAHLRRVNEDNVDLNRNFVDHASRPSDVGYAEVHPLLVPTDWDGPGRAKAEEGIKAYIAKNGHTAYQAAVTRGQYTYADGLFFGGKAPTWSNRTWRAILKEHGRGRKRVAALDFHTGLGPRGYGEIQFERGPTDPEYLRAQSWLGGEVTSPDDGTSTSAAISGYMALAVRDECPDAERTCLALEYGTLPIDAVLGAIRADNWLYARGKVDSPQGKGIKRDIREAFYGDDDAWKTDIWNRAVDVYRRMLKGLSGS
ncbi:MAG: M14 family metallopeptidase [Alphaproteobacteria bacterium]